MSAAANPVLVTTCHLPDRTRALARAPEVDVEYQQVATRHWESAA
jgi:hypothetical protein